MAPPSAPYPLVPRAAVPHAHPQPVLHVVPAKSPGVAVLLTFLWLGAGHVYVGKVGVGVGLMVFDAVLILLSIFPFLWILTVPVWWIAFVCIAIAASTAAKAFNRRNGIVVH